MNYFALNVLRIRRLKFLMFLDVLELDSGRASRILNVSESPYTRPRRVSIYKRLGEI